GRRAAPATSRGCDPAPRRDSGRAGWPSPASPCLPWRAAGVPQCIEVAQFAQRVHALPELFVAVGEELPLGGERLHRRVLPHHVGADVVERGRLDDEEAAVDPALVQRRLLLEVTYAIPVELERAEARRRPHRGQGRQTLARAVERQQLVEADVADAIAVGEHERAAADERLELAEAAARERGLAGVDQVHRPRLLVLVERAPAAVAGGDG